MEDKIHALKHVGALAIQDLTFYQADMIQKVVFQ